MPRSSYTIAINEYQRQVLLNALISNVGILAPSATAYTSPTPTDEACILRDLLAELPHADRDAGPGTVHGFCL